MPSSLKVLFVLFALGLVFMIINIGAIFKTGVFFLGLILPGFAGVAVLLLITCLTAILLYALWNRLSWAWKYAIALESFGIINSFLAFLALPKMIPGIAAQAIAENPALYKGVQEDFIIQSMNASMALVQIFTLMVFLVMIAVFYRKRSYFSGK